MDMELENNINNNEGVFKNTIRNEKIMTMEENIKQLNNEINRKGKQYFFIKFHSYTLINEKTFIQLLYNIKDA